MAYTQSHSALLLENLSKLSLTEVIQGNVHGVNAALKLIEFTKTLSSSQLLWEFT